MLNFSETKKNNCWDKEKALKWQTDNHYILGMNYLPCTAVNSTEMWEKDTFDVQTIDRELGWAHDYGYNSIRVFLPYIVYETEGEDAFFETVDRFLCICRRHEIRVVFVIFDDCAFSNLLPYYGKQREPLKLVHNSGWTASPGSLYVEDKSKYGLLKSYLQGLMKRFGNDERILMWDLYNECGNNHSGLKSMSLLKNAFEWAREAAPSQPLTSCVWSADGCELLDEISYAQSDIITFHCYADLEHMKHFVDNISASGYPLFCTEWMARVFFDCRIDTILPYFAENNISSYHWGFVNGKTQTNIPWDWNTADGEPDIWFHDVLNHDGTPYDSREMEIIKAVSDKYCFKN